MEQRGPTVSVIILNYRSPQVAVNCVEALQKQSMVDNLEIILVDNSSEDDSIGVFRNRLSKWDNVQLVETPKNTGFGSGYNYGVRYASGKYLLINNPAKTLPDDGIERLVEKIESDDSIGILAPELRHPDGSHRLSPRKYPTPLDIVIKRTWLQHIFPKKVMQYLQTDRDPGTERDVDWIAGGCFMISKELFTSLEGFDDRFFLFFEDTDLCRRCNNAGKRVVYYPAVSGSDKKRRLSEGGTWMTLSTKIGRSHLTSAIKYFWKWRKA